MPSPPDQMIRLRRSEMRATGFQRKCKSSLDHLPLLVGVNSTIVVEFCFDFFEPLSPDSDFFPRALIFGFEQVALYLCFFSVESLPLR